MPNQDIVLSPADDATVEGSRDFSKLSEQFHIIKEPSLEELAALNKEHDIYLLDRLAKELYGIPDLSLHVDKIKTIIAKE